jgi:hypothetical protein
MKSALFWDVTQREVVIPCDVSGQLIDAIFKEQDAQGKYFLTLENGTDRCVINTALRNTSEERRSQTYLLPYSFSS